MLSRASTVPRGVKVNENSSGEKIFLSLYNASGVKSLEPLFCNWFKVFLGHQGFINIYYTVF